MSKVENVFTSAPIAQGFELQSVKMTNCDGLQIFP